jgi:phenylacetate-CoA ligase
MFHFGGVNIFPSAIENFIRQVPEFSSEYQIIVPPLGSGKRLRIRIEPAKEKTEKEVMDRAVKRFVDTVKYNIKITPEVEIVDVGTLPRFEGRKARRVIREN